MKLISLLTLATLVLGIGCKSSDEQAADIASAYVESLDVYGAPLRAYSFLSTADKRAIDAESFSARFADAPPFPGAKLTVTESSQELREARVVIEIVGKDDSRATRDVVLVLEQPDKWRVHLNQSARNKIERDIERCTAAMERGDVDAAREILVPLRAAPFRGTDSNVVSARLEELAAEIEQRRRIAGLEEELGKAEQLEHEELADAISALAEKIQDDEAPLVARLNDLRAQLAAQVKAMQVKALTVTNSRVRRIMRPGGLKREAIIWLKNPLDRSLASVSVAVDYMNESTEDPIETREFQLIRKGSAPLGKGEKREFVENLEPRPEGWEGAQIIVRPIGFEFLE